MRLWDVESGTTVRTFEGHRSDVNSVTWSADNRQIISGSRDRFIKLWNTLAECKYTLIEGQHTDWVSSVAFAETTTTKGFVSCGWDKLVKVWNLSNCRLRGNLVGHTDVVYTTAVSSEGIYCASGGADAMLRVWDLDLCQEVCAADALSAINALSFSPIQNCVACVTNDSLKVFDPERKAWAVDNRPELSKCALPNGFVSLEWGADGKALYTGSTDGSISVYEAHVC